MSSFVGMSYPLLADCAGVGVVELVRALPRGLAPVRPLSLVLSDAALSSRSGACDTTCCLWCISCAINWRVALLASALWAFYYCTASLRASALWALHIVQPGTVSGCCGCGGESISSRARHSWHALSIKFLILPLQLASISTSHQGYVSGCRTAVG